MTRLLKGALAAFWLSVMLLAASAVQAASSILIWPINPTLSAEQATQPLWLENQANVPVTLQIRILRWQQLNQRNDYQPQDDVLPSPPVVTIAPGGRQLVRLTLAGNAPDSSEHAYRILVDEIPDARQQGREAQGSRVNFRMRYSVPLFVTSDEPAQKERQIARTLRWEIITDDGQRYLQVQNPGRTHARLARVRIGNKTLAEGLLGYVLAGTAYRWALPDNLYERKEITATVNGGDSVTLRHVGS